MAVVMRQISSWTKKHPVLRGMITYSILWPTSNICQQVLQERKEINFYEAMRFSLFGCFYVGPTLYTWVKISSAMFPGTGLKIALKKVNTFDQQNCIKLHNFTIERDCCCNLQVLVEQFLYSPFAISSFYIGMGLLEGKSLEKSLDEMKRKFFPTYRVNSSHSS